MYGIQRNNRVIVALAIFVCLGLVLSFSVVQSYFSPNPIKTGLTDSELAKLYKEDASVERSQTDMGHRSKEADAAVHLVPNGTRKIFLDCGANSASTVQLFQETYPGGKDYIIHSFEIDERLRPFFSSYRHQHLHCPVGVTAENGNVTVYLESVWGPDKGLNNDRDMQWGGGTLYAEAAEKEDDVIGGKRKLSVRRVVPTIDLAKWIKDNFSIRDYIILKLDVEGSEFNILQRMLQTGAFKYIDKLYGEYHNSQPTGWSRESRNQLVKNIGQAGFTFTNWEAEKHNYGDFETIHPPEVPLNTPGQAGQVYSFCPPGFVSIAVAIGMNHKRANKVVSTFQAYPSSLPITLFLYGDFIEQFPDTVRAWARRFRLGLREDGHYPRKYLEMMPSTVIRRSLVSSILRLQEIGFKSAYYWPDVSDSALTRFKPLARNRGLRIIKPYVEFPSGLDLASETYFRYRDVERIPRALQIIYAWLTKTKGGILGLDSDLPDTYLISVFLMDYLTTNSAFQLMEVEDCVRKSSPTVKKEELDLWAPKHKV